MARKTKIAISIDPALLKDIDRIAKAEGRSRSYVIELAMRESVGLQLEVVKAMSNPVVSGAFVKALTDKGVMAEMLKAMGSKASTKEIQMMERGVEGLAASLHPSKGKKAGA